ncbi:MAG: carbamoyltransferase HypF, partial [Lachnospiraceae bacterium]|nr:carbamoyltransferase HypF [Lachnospiraceae bacterium]
MFFEITVRGAVQGVGFRPYIHALAVKLNIEGCVYNEAGIVKIFICAGEEAAQKFIEAIGIKPPEGAVITSITSDILSEKPPVFSALEEKTAPESFKILESPKNSGLTGEELPVILPDIGICSSCLKEMLDPSNRRYAYPLISCTACGPRYSIIKALPYDRERTSMSAFELCPECTEEYGGRKRPLNAALRHHAQTIGCHSCGPQYIFRTTADKSSSGDAIRLAIAALSAGEVVGLKGTGGYQLLADPFNHEAVKYLRGIKGREKKPFAVMFSKLEDIREYACVSVEEERALRSPARPIVLLDKKAGAAKEFAYETAADSRYIGAFLPSIGIHRLLCDALGPLIVTSANISNEPIIISDEKFKKIFLDKIAGVLEHDREILSPADDSVVYNLQETRSMQYIRRARGYAPMAVLQGRSGIGKGISEGVLYGEDGRHGVNITSKPDILSFGADLKAAFCMSRNGNAVLSQYFGDMENYETRENYLRELKRAETLFGFKPGIAVCDKHPLYVS